LSRFSLLFCLCQYVNDRFCALFFSRNGGE